MAIWAETWQRSEDPPMEGKCIWVHEKWCSGIILPRVGTLRRAWTLQQAWNLQWVCSSKVRYIIYTPFGIFGMVGEINAWAFMLNLFVSLSRSEQSSLKSLKMWVRPGTPTSCYIDIHWERFEIAEIFLFQDGNFDFSSIVNDPRNVTCLTFLESGDVITGDDIG